MHIYVQLVEKVIVYGLSVISHQEPAITHNAYIFVNIKMHVMQIVSVSIFSQVIMTAVIGRLLVLLLLLVFCFVIINKILKFLAKRREIENKMCIQNQQLNVDYIHYESLRFTNKINFQMI